MGLLRKVPVFSIIPLLVVVLLRSPQGQTVAEAYPAIPMPLDRADESYRIYSSLTPFGELGNAGWPKDLWLLADTTMTLEPADQPCIPPPSSASLGQSLMNPHNAIRAPEDRRAEFAEVLDDFDRHCHERVQLTREPWKLTKPFLLLTDAEQAQFRSIRMGGNADAALAAKFKGAPGLTTFSQVYFNAHHTLAMVYGLGWCGGLCANGFWVVLELRDGQWHSLPWVHTRMYS